MIAVVILFRRDRDNPTRAVSGPTMTLEWVTAIGLVSGFGWICFEVGAAIARYRFDPEPCARRHRDE